MAAEQVVEQVAENLEEAAVVVRHINPKIVGYSLGGLAVGIVIGFAIGYHWNRKKIRAEIFAEAEEDIEKIRELYRDSARVVREREVKPDLDQVIEDRQYSTTPHDTEEERPTKPPVVVHEPTPRIILETGKSRNLHWDQEEELANRSEESPYIIHQDEYIAQEKGYKQEVLTWYAGDDVLTDEQEQPISNADDLVGLEHMSKFGHGTDDFNVLFVRNDRVRMEYEICRMSTSYEEEVQGLSNDDEPH